MKTFLLIISVALSALTASAQTPYVLLKATVTLPVQYAGIKAKKPALLTKTLKNNDIINLALGVPPDTKVDPKKVGLAVAGNLSTPGVDSKVVVLDLETKQVLANLWNFTTFDVTFSNPPDIANPTSAVVYVEGDVVATTKGTPALNGFDATSFAAAGTGKTSANGAIAASTTALCGHFTFHVTGDDNNTVSYSGVVTKGTLKTGASLGMTFQ